MFDIDPVVKDGLEAIASAQQKAGNFISLSSLKQADFADAIPYSTTFFTSAILACLAAAVNNERYHSMIDPIRTRATTFLLKEKSNDWSFNYWARNTKEYKTTPYPDDLDDTFSALVALMQYNRALIDGEALAAIITMLTSVEAQEGGPYRTWLIAAPTGSWSDVDLVVNSTVGYFLSLADIRLPNIKTLIDDALSNNALRSPYYPSSAHALYFISRFYKNCGSDDTIQKATNSVLRFRKDHAAEMTPLENALTTTSLINLGAIEEVADSDVEKLSISMMEEKWKPYAFCIDPSREGTVSYAGASSLTAAACIEMLMLYENATTREKPDSKNKGESENDKDDRLHKKIIILAKRAIRHTNISPPLNAVITQKIDAVTDRRITLVAHEFKRALGARGATIRQKTIDQLALGNLCGWIAYAIYDDILDDEGGVFLLPAANFFLRALAHVYEKENSATPGYTRIFSYIMNIIDSANAWEQEHCRLPDDAKNRLPEKLPRFGIYDDLANRSIGHAMGPLAELLAAGYEAGSKEHQSVLALFRHYLVARQLHDDAHDWVQDLLRGRVNSVGAIVIEKFQNDNPCRVRENIVDALPNMQEIFWKEIVDVAVVLIDRHIAAARAARKAFIAIHDANFLEEALTALESSARKTLAERDDTLLFLAHYHPGRHPMTPS